jgi:hypothetical protein
MLKSDGMSQDNLFIQVAWVGSTLRSSNFPQLDSDTKFPERAIDQAARDLVKGARDGHPSEVGRQRAETART